MLSINKALFWILLSSFFFQQFWITGFVTPIKPYMIVVLFSALFIVLTYKGRKFHCPTYTYVVGVFYIYMIFTSMWADKIELSFVRSVGILLLVLAYFVLVQLSSYVDLNNNRNLSLYLHLFLIAIILYYIIGAYLVFISGGKVGSGFEQGVLGIYYEGVLPRLRGFADSPNNMGLLLLPLFYVVYILRVSVSRTYYVTFFAILLLTLSFSTFVSFFLPLLIAVLLIKQRWAVWFFLGMLPILAAFLYFYYSSEFVSNIINARFERLSTGSGRFELFSYSFDLISERPFFGSGISQAREFLVGFQGRSLQSTHNSFIEIFLEGGVVGLILFCFCWLSIAWHIAKANVEATDRVLLFSYLASLFVFSNANLMVYLELMVFNLFCIFLILRNLESSTLRKYSPSLCS